MPLPNNPAAEGFCPCCHQLHILPYSEETVATADNLCKLLQTLLLDPKAIIPAPFTELDLLPLAQSNEGKMVAVVKLQSGKWAFAISGQLHRQYHLNGFADHLAAHDSLADIAHRARVLINPITDQINALKKAGRPFDEILPLKLKRRHISSQLCAENQALYKVANQNGQLKSLPEIWNPPPQYSGHGIPTGVGDCALPKILHWANLHNELPIAACEFWWGGQNNPRPEWTNGTIIPACAEKCQGILGYLLCNS